MWIKFGNLGEIEDGYLLSIGRALLLAQSFEETCKRVFMWSNVAKHIRDNRIEDIEGLEIREFMDRFLGVVLKDLGTVVHIPTSEQETLRQAKDARNYIAHQVTHPCMRCDRTGEAILVELASVKDNVLKLAQGHNVIACWLYEMEERKPAPPTLKHIYPAEALDWVLCPVNKALAKI